MSEPKDLLDLPPELLLNVIEYYVAATGVREAWKGRIVCITFAGYIKDVFATKQPLEVLRNPDNRKLIERLLPDILKGSLYRDAIPRLLPNLMWRIADKITVHRGSATNNDRNTAVGEVCSIVGLSDSAWRLCFLPKTLKNTDKYATAPADDETLCVAIGIDDRALIRALLAAGVSMWKECKLFGHTWEFAANCGSFATFQFLVNATQMPMEGHKRAIHNNMLRNRMIALLDGPKKYCAHKEDCAVELLKLGATQLGHPTRGTSMQLFKAAYKCGAARFISELLQLVPTDFAEAWRDEIRAYVLSHDNDIKNHGIIIQHLLDRGIFSQGNINVSAFIQDGHSIHVYIPNSDKLRYRSLLDIAISTNGQDLVSTILDLGAHPDGADRPELHNIHGLQQGDSHIAYEKSYPLAVALKQNLPNIAEALLQAGASATMGMTTNGAARFTMKHGEIGPRVQGAIFAGLREWDSEMWLKSKAR